MFAHRVIFAKNSKLYQDFLASSPRCSTSDVIICPDLTKRAVSIVLEILYTGVAFVKVLLLPVIILVNKIRFRLLLH